MSNQLFLQQLDSTLKELLLLGYGIIEDAYLLELDNLSQIASKMGFDALRVLIERLYSACQDYLRLDNQESAMEITKSIALLEFALANLNLGVGSSELSQENIEQALAEYDQEQES